MTNTIAKAPVTGMDRIFEYQVFDHGRWVTMQAFHDENMAIDTAQSALHDLRHDRVRVLSVRPAGETIAINRVIFQKEIEMPVKDVRMGELFDRPAICHEPQDLYGANARLTLNRLLGEYCQRHVVTVTEILHSRFQFRQLKQNEELLNHALEHVGRLQWTEEVSAGERVTTLRHLLRQVDNRIDTLTGGNKASSLMDRFHTQAHHMAADHGDDIFALGAIWAEFLNTRSTLLSKLAITLEIGQSFEDAPPTAVTALQDLQLADLLYNPELHELLFGPLGSRGELIYLLLALAEGVIGDYGIKPRPIADDVREHLTLVKKMFANGQLNCSREHLLNLAIQHLNNLDPLDHRDQNTNNALFRQIVELMAQCPNLLNESRLILALTKRVSRHANVNSGNLVVEARHVGVLMKHPAMAIVYWVRLHDNSRNQDLKRGLAHRMIEIIDTTTTAHDLVPGRLSIQQRMTQLTMCYNALAHSGIDERVMVPMLERLDQMILDFTRETKMLERLNDPGLSLRDRAFRLVRFCGSGLLPEGMILFQIRQNVIEMLRRPRFDDELVDGLTEASDIATTQRQFFEALHKAGFAV